MPTCSGLGCKLANAISWDFCTKLEDLRRHYIEESLHSAWSSWLLEDANSHPEESGEILALPQKEEQIKLVVESKTQPAAELPVFCIKTFMGFVKKVATLCQTARQDVRALNHGLTLYLTKTVTVHKERYSVTKEFSLLSNLMVNIKHKAIFDHPPRLSLPNVEAAMKRSEIASRMEMDVSEEQSCYFH